MSPQMLDPNSEPDEAIEVSWEDQTRINSFSKLNTRLQEVEENLKDAKEEKDYLEDLSMELELADEDEPVLYKIGDSFFHLPLPSAQRRLEKDSSSIDSRIEELKTKKKECESGMSELKVLLYARFGKQINLESGSED